MRSVLIISTVGLNNDGITNVILSNLKVMNTEGLRLYVVSTIKAEEGIRRQFENLNCTIVGLPNRKANTMHYFLKLYKFIRDKKIEVIHAHGNSATLAIETVAAFWGGCKKRIVHSHTTKCEQVLADRLLRGIFYLTYTDALACGEKAGKWLYKKRPFSVIKNGRDVELFKFSPETRRKMREKLGIYDNIAIAHVGGFIPPKNHLFILKIYKCLLKKDNHVKLFLIGDGYLRQEIQDKAASYGMKDSIIFTGNVNNVADYLNAMDAMILPSISEGMPLVTIEWQINGLPCLVSDTITKECAITSCIKFKTLNDSAESWSEEIYTMANAGRIADMQNNINMINDAGFNIEDSANKLRMIYLS